MLVCPVSGVGKKELGDGQNKKISSASRQNKKKEGKEWAGPPTVGHLVSNCDLRRIVALVGIAAYLAIHPITHVCTYL